MVRTRSAAAALVEAGYVRLNGRRIAGAGHKVTLGDVLTLALDRSVRVLRVEGFCERREASPVARTLYRELTASGFGVSAPAQVSRKAVPSVPAF